MRKFTHLTYPYCSIIEITGRKPRAILACFGTGGSRWSGIRNITKGEHNGHDAYARTGPHKVFGSIYGLADDCAGIDHNK